MRAALGSAMLVLWLATACTGATPSLPTAASLNAKGQDMPSDLQRCQTMLDRLKLSTPEQEASARKLGAVEFSAVNFANDPNYCATGQRSISGDVRLVQALLIRFRDTHSAQTAYQSNVVGVGSLTDPARVIGSGTGFGPESVSTVSGPLFFVAWQKGAYVYKGLDAFLSMDESIHVIKDVYSRVPS